MKKEWAILNPAGAKRIVATKDLPGNTWRKVLSENDCRIEVCTSPAALAVNKLRSALGTTCDGVIGQLNETWDNDLLSALHAAGGRVYCNYAVGFDNVDVRAATSLGIAIGNTPEVLTEATAEMGVALTFAAARRVTEADDFMRAGKFTGWRHSLFLGELLTGRTLGVVGAGRIGSAYARMMVEGHKMSLMYFNTKPNTELENYVASYGKFLGGVGQSSVTCRRASTIEELLSAADVIALFPALNEKTFHLLDGKRLSLMKEHAVLVNLSRGPVIDETALVQHCRTHPNFRAGLDVYEKEPKTAQGLLALSNVVLAPHLGSATLWTREAMATLAARNVAAVLNGFPAWDGGSVLKFLGESPPKAAPSIVNARGVGMISLES
ncbi:MAG: D-glycerate dehydrogenase [Bacteroidota bacterium]|nr:D-glycerate dehydrogenase [Bacteroidota bacterium]